MVACEVLLADAEFHTICFTAATVSINDTHPTYMAYHHVAAIQAELIGYPFSKLWRMPNLSDLLQPSTEALPSMSRICIGMIRYSMYVCIYVCMYVYRYTQLHTYVYVYVHVCRYIVCIYKYKVYIYTDVNISVYSIYIYKDM